MSTNVAIIVASGGIITTNVGIIVASRGIMTTGNCQCSCRLGG